MFIVESFWLISISKVVFIRQNLVQMVKKLKYTMEYTMEYTLKMKNGRMKNDLLFFFFFSVLGKYIAVGLERLIQIWKTPGKHKEFAPFVLQTHFTGHSSPVICLDWASDSK